MRADPIAPLSIALPKTDYAFGGGNDVIAWPICLLTSARDTAGRDARHNWMLARIRFGLSLHGVNFSHIALVAGSQPPEQTTAAFLS